VRVGLANLEGDRQSDLRNHGGRDKAVYAYPAEHYAAWRAELAEGPRPGPPETLGPSGRTAHAAPTLDLSWGAFGENLTINGLDERRLGIGDELRAGSARLSVTMPRIPCFKLGLRLGRPDVVRRMSSNGRCGTYLRVLEEGEVRSGDAVVRVARGEHGISVAQLFRLIMSDDLHGEEDLELLRIAGTLPTIPESVRERLVRRRAAATGA
jgi:MOSC domain-containing protein YiiM